MAFSALPAELVLNIVECMDPDSTLNLALTCKSHSTLCKSVLVEHGRLLSEWQIVDTTDAGTLLWETLKEVLEDPRKGWYVRELNLPGSRQYSWNPEMSLFPPPPHAGLAPSDQEKEMFKAAARKLTKLYPTLESDHTLARGSFQPYLSRPNNLICTIEDRIDFGIEDAIVAILLHHLPYLNTIRLTGVDDTSDCLELMMHRIAGGYKDPAMAPKLPLQHLKTAAVAYGNTEGCITPDWACAFLSIPSLRTFAAYAMGGSPTQAVRDCYLRTGAEPCSNVSELFFARSQFEVEGLEVILAGIKNLQKLTYRGGDASVSYSQYEPRKLIQALAKHVGHSLEELVLDQEEEDVEVRRRPRGPYV